MSPGLAAAAAFVAELEDRAVSVAMCAIRRLHPAAQTAAASIA